MGFRFSAARKAFEGKLTVEGVYDCYCAPHEMAGMIGRLVVGKPIGPGTLPFDYFVAEGRNWQSVSRAAQKAFPAICAKGVPCYR